MLSLFQFINFNLLHFNILKKIHTLREIRLIASISRIRLLESNCSWPKVILLSGAHCIWKFYLYISAWWWILISCHQRQIEIEFEPITQELVYETHMLWGVWKHQWWGTLLRTTIFRELFIENSLKIMTD